MKLSLPSKRKDPVKDSENYSSVPDPYVLWFGPPESEFICRDPDPVQNPDPSINKQKNEEKFIY